MKPNKPKRSCGECTACCLTHPIVEIRKPAGEWCPHCNINQGCKIYQDRPRGCKGFECQWLIGKGAENDRPDKAGIVMDYLPLPEVGETLTLFEAIPGGLMGPLAVALIQEHLLAEEPILTLPLKGDNMLQFPDSALMKSPPAYFRINGKNTKVIYKKRPE